MSVIRWARGGRPPRALLVSPDEHGYTIIELMVVVLIIAILIAIAIPTFLGARARATDRHAQSLVRDGLVAGRIVSSDGKTYAAVTAADLKTEEAELAFVDAATPAAADAQQVSVASGTSGSDTYLVLASGSASGSCFAARAMANGATEYQRATTASCTANSFNPTSGWGPAWP